MHVKRLRSAQSAGFTTTPISTPAERPIILPYLKQKSSFLIASLALVAFVTGNMMGKHGWEVFWASVMGGFDDSLIAYEGTVPPVDRVPDYTRWAAYGGSAELHTFRQVPLDLLIPLPRYVVDASGMPTNPIYSVGYMGSYDGQEGAGSHPGIDIRLPVGTPVRAVMNGIVVQVGYEAGGFGKYVVIRHPNVPDPDNPKQSTTLYSAYAHLNAQLVQEGQVVSKGEDIAYSGQTGNASGPHLHFQMDRDITVTGETTPWHPYWPFSADDMRLAGFSFSQAINRGLGSDRGYLYTVHPLNYVQANYAPTAIAKTTTTAAVTTSEAASSARSSSSSASSTPSVIARGVSALTRAKSRLLQAREERLRKRIALQRYVPSARVAAAPTTTSSAPQPHSAAPAITPVDSIAIQHDGTFTPGEWKDVRLTLLDSDGETTSAAGLTGKLYLRTAFGYATFDPDVLTAANFVNGEAVVRVQPQGRQTVVIDIKPMDILSKPLTYAGR